VVGKVAGSSEGCERGKRGLIARCGEPQELRREDVETRSRHCRFGFRDSLQRTRISLVQAMPLYIES
jgi:hypothetical protein